MDGSKTGTEEDPSACRVHAHMPRPLVELETNAKPKLGTMGEKERQLCAPVPTHSGTQNSTVQSMLTTPHTSWRLFIPEPIHVQTLRGHSKLNLCPVS